MTSSDTAAPVLRGHGRYDYRAISGRPDFTWPGGRRLAVYFGINLEHFAFGEGLGAELAPGGPQPDVLNYAWRDYGNRVGGWRMRDLFAGLGLPATLLVNSSIYGYCPELVAAFRADGAEIVAHGRTNSERQGTLGEDDERRLIDEATRVIAAHEGTPPRGWLGPWISQSAVTPDLLGEAGYGYLLDWAMDEQPVWMRTRDGRRILSVPYQQELNDIPAIVARKDTGRAFAEAVLDGFEEMLERSEEAPLVLGIALHPYLVGQPHRLRPLRPVLERIAACRDRVWLTTAGAVAEHFAALSEQRPELGV